MGGCLGWGDEDWSLRPSCSSLGCGVLLPLLLGHPPLCPQSWLGTLKWAVWPLKQGYHFMAMPEAGHILLDVNVQGIPSLVCVYVCSHMCICTHCMCMFEVCSWSVNNSIPHLQTWSITISPGMLNLRGVPECPWIGREEEIQEKVSSTHFSSLSLLAWLTDL